MKVLITGASSGLGKQFAKIYYSKGCDLILVARNIDKLNKLKRELELEKSNSKIEIVSLDLSKEENCENLVNRYRDVDILINNAGFGDCGYFDSTSLDKELSMIDTNIIAYHILTKLYLIQMEKRKFGKILNVASIAGFLPGPLMATYYASKSYVVRLSEGVNQELKKKKSSVKISILCPGPVKTNFSSVANVKFKLKEADSSKIAKYTIKKFEKGKFYIVPKFEIKLVRFLAKLVPTSLVSQVVYKVQRKKL